MWRLLGICYDLIPEITGSDNIQLPFIILFAEFLEGFHHQIKALWHIQNGWPSENAWISDHIYCSLTKLLGLILTSVSISEEFLIIPLVIIAEYNISVQFWKIFLKQAFLFPENNIRDIQISGIAVVLPANGLCIQTQVPAFPDRRLSEAVVMIMS